MGYKILKITRFYTNFLTKIYTENKELQNLEYQKQYSFLMKQFFGWADSYEYHLSEIGYETYQIIANAENLQKQWAKENNIKEEKENIIIEQIKKFKPEVLFIQDPYSISSDSIIYLKKELKSLKLILGYRCAPIGEKEYQIYNNCDLVLTCSEHLQSHFKKQNLSSEILGHAFDKRILNHINPIKNNDVVFIGNIIEGAGFHNKRKELIDTLINEPSISLKVHSEKFNNAKYGLDYFNLLSSSFININSHIDASENMAGNMRLFETTGVGTCLVTDFKSNLAKLFDINEELVCYENAEDAVEKISWLIKNPKKCQEIAKKAQKRTLENYNFSIRAKELDLIINKYIK